MTSLHLLGIGGAHLDRRGQVTGIYVAGASNPGTMREDIGGVVFNALRTARMLDTATTLISLRGGDQAGERIAETVSAAGVADRSVVFLDRTTASYTALIDRNGDLIAGLADMGLYDMFPRILRRSSCRAAIAAAHAVLIDANLPEAAIAQVVTTATAPVHAIGISPVKVMRLASVVDRLSCLFLNRREAEALGATGPDAGPDDLAAALRALGLAQAVVTQGAGPALIIDADGVAEIEPPAPRRIVDVTGAGDALAGATVAGLMRGMRLSQAARHGVAAAMLALESVEAVPAATPEAMAEALAVVPPARRKT